MIIKHKRSNKIQHTPSPEQMEYGEIAINYSTGEECLFIKNDNNKIIKLGENIKNKKLETFTGTTITCIPNVYYRKTNTSTSLTIYLDTETDATILNEYFIEFTTSTNGTTISLPSTIKWVNGKLPTFENNTTYQISIINNLGICVKFN